MHREVASVPAPPPCTVLGTPRAKSTNQLPRRIHSDSYVEGIPFRIESRGQTDCLVTLSMTGDIAPGGKETLRVSKTRRVCFLPCHLAGCAVESAAGVGRSGAAAVRLSLGERAG